MEADGNSLFAVSDVGGWLAADIKYDGTRPSGLANARLGPMLAVSGRPLEDKREQDAEVAGPGRRQPDARHASLIGFERLHRHRPLRDPRRRGAGADRLHEDAGGSPTHERQPGPGRRRRAAGGPLKGAVVAFAERLTRGSGYHTGWIWTGGEPKSFQLRDIDGFDLTDAAGLPTAACWCWSVASAGREGVKMRIRHLTAAEIKPGARLDGRTLIQADFELRDRQHGGHRRAPRPRRRDHRLADVRRQLQSLLQRKLLLQFTLLERGPRNVARP